MSQVALENAESNVLLDVLGPVPTDKDLILALTKLVKGPPPSAILLPHEVIYQVRSVRALRVPSPDLIQLARTIDVVLRDGYRDRDPRGAKAWRLLKETLADATDEGLLLPAVNAPTVGAGIFGASGTGKTEGYLLPLKRYPQVIRHETFPRVRGGLTQLVWIRVDMPSTGKLHDLSAAIVAAAAEALEDSDIAHALKPDRRDPEGSFQRVIQFLRSRFLGVLVIDEIQDLFRLQPVKVRSRKGVQADHELRIADDVALKGLMQFINVSGIPLVVAGTSDGKRALQKRFAVAQRLIGEHSHEIAWSRTAKCKVLEQLVTALTLAQWSHPPLKTDAKLLEVIHSCTAGIRRLVVAHWCAAHRVMAAEGKTTLTLDHFIAAGNGPLAAVRNAVTALLTGSPEGLRRYEDLYAAFQAADG